MKCELCARENILTFHHLIPKCLHTNKWFKANYSREQMNKGLMLCKYECHKEIHLLISNKDLGKYYNTKKLLLSHINVKSYIKWIKKKYKNKPLYPASFRN